MDKEKERKESVIDVTNMSGVKLLCLQKYASFAGEPMEYMQFAVVDEKDPRVKMDKDMGMKEGSEKVGKVVMSKKDMEIMTDHAPMLLLVQTNQKIEDVLVGMKYIEKVIVGAGRRQEEHEKEKEGGKGRGMWFHVGAMLFCIWNLPKVLWDGLIGKRKGGSDG